MSIICSVSIFSHFKAVTACILCMFCRASTYFDTIKITIIILVMQTCLYCTF